MKSSKEKSIDQKLTDFVESLNLSGKALSVLKLLLTDKEIKSAQEYANTVSITRLGFNDHGPVHMRIVALNAIRMIDLLKKAGIKTSLESDGCGNFEDSLTAVMIASMLHDIGMGMCRQNHEHHSTILAYPLIDKVLNQVYSSSSHKVTIIRAMSLEGVAGHMGSISVSSLEAGIVQIADGCDMTKGRARIPMALQHAEKKGLIHQYSANSIEEVRISAGVEKPVRVDVNMSNAAGLFQVEEVLMHKIAGSTAKTYIELYAQVRDETAIRYL